MAGSTTFVDCTDLDAFRVFGDYADILRNRTSFNETLLRECQKPICRALWGFGVPDLSGIGVAIGYGLSIVISTALCLMIAFRRPPSASSPTERDGRQSSKSIVLSGLSSYFESAVYFSLAIQIATITIMAPKDLETAPSSIGYYEIRIAGLVSTLSLLPLLTPVVLLLLHDYDYDHDPTHSSARPSPQTNRNKHASHRSNNQQQNEYQGIPTRDKENRHPYRLSVLSLTVLASVYTFFSQSIRYWSPSTLGDHKGDGGKTEISDQERGILWDLCFGDLQGTSFSPVEHVTVGAFHMVASIVVVLFTAALLAPVIARRLAELTENEDDDDGREGNNPGSGGILGFTKRSVKYISGLVKKSTWARVSLVGVAFVLTVPLLWGFFRLRDIQTRLALAAGGSYEGNDWGFGQVMAIAVFAPVATEMLFVWIRRRRLHVDDDGQKQNGQREQDDKTETTGQERSNEDAESQQVGESISEVQGRDRIKTWPW